MRRVDAARNSAFSFASISTICLGVVACLALTSHPAIAGGIGGNAYASYLGDLGYFLSGPFARFIGAAVIIAGVIILVRQGTQVGGETFNVIAVIAITIGLLALVLPHITSIVKPIGGGGGGGGSSYFPSLTQGIGDVAGPIVSVAVPVLGAIILVGGIYRYSRDEHHVGLRTIGEVAVAIGVLCVGAGFVASAGSGCPI